LAWSSGRKTQSILGKEKNMTKYVALMVCLVFAFVAVAPMAWATQPGSGMTYEGTFNIPGKVEKTPEGYVLKASSGEYRLKGADPAPWVGKTVKAWGSVSENEGTMVQTINVNKFEPAKKK
jgi:hypothetical protein